jgi:hypothetical protein
MRLDSKTWLGEFEVKSPLKKLEGPSIDLILARKKFRNPANEVAQSMKTFWLISFALSIMLSPVAQAQTLPNSGPIKLKILATAQSLFHAMVSSKTNSTATTTNVTTVFKSTTTNTIIQNADFLRLIENSFNTNLPDGAQLVASGNNFSFLGLYVADSTGSNVVLDLSSNVFIGVFADEQSVDTEVRAGIATTSSSGTSVSVRVNDTATSTVILGYDDSGLVTKDGTHTKFQITCLSVRKSSGGLLFGPIKEKFSLSGVGYGTIRGQGVILQGEATASVSGVLPPPPPPP